MLSFKRSTRSEMGQLRGHRVCLLLLLFTAVAGKHISSLTVGVGDKVTLPCGNVIKNQNKCDRTSWLFTQAATRPTAELVSLGQIAKARSDKVSITEDCSLVVKDVSSQQTGQYVCRQFTKSNQQGLFSLVYLSVVAIVNSGVPGKIDFQCKVYGKCAHTVKWIYPTDIKTEDTKCSSTVSFQTIHDGSNMEDSLLCSVKDHRNGQTLLCNSSMCVLTGETSAVNETVDDEEIQTIPVTGNCSGSRLAEDAAMIKAAWIRMSAFCVGLMVLIVTVVMVDVWTRTKGKKKWGNHRAEQNGGDDDDDGMYDSILYENPEGHDPSVRLGRSQTRV